MTRSTREMSTTSCLEERDSCLVAHAGLGAECVEIGVESVEGILVYDEAAASDSYVEYLFHNFSIVVCLLFYNANIYKNIITLYRKVYKCKKSCTANMRLL